MWPFSASTACNGLGRRGRVPVTGAGQSPLCPKAWETGRGGPRGPAKWGSKENASPAPPGDWSDPALLRTTEALLRSHFTLVRCGREAPSLCFCPEPAVEGAVAMAPEGSARCSEMPGRLNAIAHQVLCM